MSLDYMTKRTCVKGLCNQLFRSLIHDYLKCFLVNVYESTV